MNERGSSSELTTSGFSRHVPIDTNPEGVDPLGGWENLFTHLFSILPPEQIPSSESPNGTPEDRAIDFHHPAFGSDHNGYLIARYSGFPQQAFSASTYLQEDARVAAAFQDGTSYSDDQHVPQLPPTQFFASPVTAGAVLPDPALRMQNSPMTDGFQVGYAHSHTEKNFNSDIYDEKRQQDSREIPQLDRTATQPLDRLDHAQGTPVLPNEADRWKSTGGLPPQITGAVGNQGTAQVPAESMPPGTDDVEAQQPKKGKRSTTLGRAGGGQERKRLRRKKQRQIEVLEFIPDSLASPWTRDNLLAVMQIKYQCENVQKDWKPLPPITFVTVQGWEGINLVDALNMRFNFNGRDDAMFTQDGVGNAISLRVEFLGQNTCDAKARQIPTKNHKKAHGPITRQKLAHDVAKLIGVHLEKNPFHVPFKSMVLVRLHNVSHGSWQPEIWHNTTTT